MNKIIHKRSSVITDGKAKLPNNSQLEYGELAINYASGVETITLKNTNNEIVEFKSSEYLEKVIKENNDDIKDEVLGIKEQIDTLLQDFEETDEAYAAALTDLDSRVIALESADMSEYATDTELANAVSTLEGEITSGITGVQTQVDTLRHNFEETDEVLVAALNTLDKKINDVDSDIEGIYGTIENLENGTFKVSKAANADYATKATQDGSGRTITSTYSTTGHTHTSANVTDSISVGSGITSGSTGIVQGKAIYDYAATKDSLNAVSTKVDTLVGSDSDKSVRTIANEELAAQLLSGKADADFKTLQELASWLEDHPESAAEMNEAISANTTAISDEVSARETAVSGVQAQIETLRQDFEETDEAYAAALTDIDSRVVALENADMSDFATDAELASAVSTLEGKITSGITAVQTQIDALDNTYATDAELANAVSTLEGKITSGITGVQTQVDTLRQDFEESDEVHVAALNTLDKRINDVDSGIESIYGTFENLENGTFKVSKAANADYATKATQDGSGRTITSTYSTIGHTHTSANVTDSISVGSGITSGSNGLVQGKAIYDYAATKDSLNAVQTQVDTLRQDFEESDEVYVAALNTLDKKINDKLLNVRNLFCNGGGTTPSSGGKISVDVADLGKYQLYIGSLDTSQQNYTPVRLLASMNTSSTGPLQVPNTPVYLVAEFVTSISSDGKISAIRAIAKVESNGIGSCKSTSVTLYNNPVIF